METLAGKVMEGVGIDLLLLCIVTANYTGWLCDTPPAVSQLHQQYNDRSVVFLSVDDQVSAKFVTTQFRINIHKFINICMLWECHCVRVLLSNLFYLLDSRPSMSFVICFHLSLRHSPVYCSIMGYKIKIDVCGLRALSFVG